MLDPQEGGRLDAKAQETYWMVFGQLVLPVQCCGGARRRAVGAPAQHCTGHDQLAKYHLVPNVSWHQVFRLAEG